MIAGRAPMLANLRKLIQTSKALGEPVRKKQKKTTQQDRAKVNQERAAIMKRMRERRQ